MSNVATVNIVFCLFVNCIILSYPMCTHRRTAVSVVAWSASSGRAIPQHTEKSVYRCYLPVLTGFTGFCCTGPSLQHHLTNGQPKQALPSGGSSTPVERIPGNRAPLTPHLAHRTKVCNSFSIYARKSLRASCFWGSSEDRSAPTLPSLRGVPISIGTTWQSHRKINDRDCFFACGESQ